jgi:hypothetical protein
MRRLFYIIPLFLILVSCGMQRSDLFNIAARTNVRVYSYDPVNSTVPIPINAKVTVAFNTNMDTGSVEDAFSIEFGGVTYTANDGWFEWFAWDRAFVFHYDPDHSGGDDLYPEGTDITVRVNTKARNEQGYYLTKSLEWTFTPSTSEDNNSPNVSFSDPPYYADDINPPAGYVEIVFSEPMNKSSVALGFALASSDWEDVRTIEQGLLQWHDENMKATYSLHDPLQIGLKYTVWLGYNGIDPCDLAGNPLGAVSHEYPSKWAKSIKIVVNHDQVPKDVKDFPVYVDLSLMPSADSSFFSAESDTNGDDIIITNASRKAKLPRELVYIDTTGGNQGELWFKAPKLSSSSTEDNTFYLCYDAPTGVVEPNKTDVWSNGYIGVYHLQDDTFFDSSPNNNTGTALESDLYASGMMGEARSFDGINDYIQLPDIIKDAGTVSMWINPMVWTNPRKIFYASVGITEFFLDLESEHLRFRITDTKNYQYEASKDVGLLPAPDWWYHVAGVWRYKESIYEILNPPVPAAQLYFEGVSADLSSYIIGMRPPLAAPHIGHSSNSFNGIIDEIHISNVRRSAEWIKTEYNNQNYLVTGFFITIEPVVE